ncbi:MAG: beta-Ala-His dipeptidase [Dethiobacteria bacterium]|nr:aminoacyl-histidine dipeptidase [Bacillota bacterium]
MSVLNHKIPFERYFEEISQIPRCSGNEAALSNYLVDFAKKHGLQYDQDPAGNVIIFKLPSPGYENSPTVILQAHMDMVCEKDPDCEHDFSKDPLQLYLEGPENNILRARGTTLGADDGMGVAQQLAILANNTSPHPALECVFTVEEENGMRGAAVFDYSKLSGRLMITLDCGQEENSIVASCGGMSVVIKKNFSIVPLKGKVAAFKVNGLLGGHSGIVVNQERGNAIKLAGRVLCELLYGDIDLNLVAINGGSKHNIVPKECSVVFACPEEQMAKAQLIIKRTADDIKNELRASDSGFYLQIMELVKANGEMFSGADSKKIVALIEILPNDVYRRSVKYEGVVTASNCLSVIKTTASKVEVYTSIRAQTDALLCDLYHKIDLSAKALNFETKTLNRYPCWPFKEDSMLRDRVDQLMQRLWNKSLKGRRVHGGLEAGYFAANLPGIEIIGIGPYCGEVHTTREWLDVRSAHRVYRFLLTLLAEMKE